MGYQIQFAPERASSVAGHVDALFYFLVALSAFFAILVAGLVIVFAVKYRRKSEDQLAQPVSGGYALELTWTFVPLVLALGIFAWSAKLYFEIAKPPQDAVEMYATGKQWMWKIQHPEGKREINELHVPVGKAVRLKMTSEDVIHSFYIPAFRMKMDVLPGRYTNLWFKPTKAGKYHLFCAEYCGTKHSGMIGWVYVMEPAEYENWLSGGAEGGTMAQRGAKLFEELACNNCHHADGKGRGPSLEGIYGNVADLEGGQKAKVDDAYIRESILQPQAKLVRGYQGIMPTFQGLVTEDQLAQLIEYVKSLARSKEAPGGKAPAPAPAAKPKTVTQSAAGTAAN